MNWKTLDGRTDGRGVVEVRLTTPEKRNVLSPLMIAELTEMATTISNESKTRAIVLSDAGTIGDTIRRLADAWETPEALHGVSAFLDKRTPAWAQPTDGS